MGSGPSHEEDQRRIRAKILAVGALSPKSKMDHNAGSTKSSVRDFVEAQKRNKEELWKEIEAQYDQNNERREGPQESSEDEEVLEAITTCPICSKNALYDSLCCRVCGVCYHLKCLTDSHLASKQEVDLFQSIVKAVGWSCSDCDMVYKLLTLEELTEIRVQFEAVDSNQDLRVSLEEYMAYQKAQFEAEEGRPMTSFEENYERLHFRRLDADGSGFVDFPEFLKFRAGTYLSRRDKGDLVKLLSKREIRSARMMFNQLDQEQNGSLSLSELHVAYHGWYKALKGSGLQISPSQLADRRVEMVMEGDADNDRLITWDEYLRSQALYILASRPNGSYYFGPYVTT